jgi:hypothetical protein
MDFCVEELEKSVIMFSLITMNTKKYVYVYIHIDKFMFVNIYV